MCMVETKFDLFYFVKFANVRQERQSVVIIKTQYLTWMVKPLIYNVKYFQIRNVGAWHFLSTEKKSKITSLTAL